MTSACSETGHILSWAKGGCIWIFVLRKGILEDTGDFLSVISVMHPDWFKIALSRGHGRLSNGHQREAVVVPRQGFLVGKSSWYRGLRFSRATHGPMWHTIGILIRPSKNAMDHATSTYRLWTICHNRQPYDKLYVGCFTEYSHDFGRVFRNDPYEPIQVFWWIYINKNWRTITLWKR